MSDPYHKSNQAPQKRKRKGGCLKLLMILFIVGFLGLLLLGAVGGVVYLNRDKLAGFSLKEMVGEFKEGLDDGGKGDQSKKTKAGSAEARRPIVARSPMHANKSNFAKLSERSDVLVLVDYYADWCGPCKRLAPSLAQLAQKHGDKVIVLKVNVDQDSELAQQAGVSSIPDVRILHSGKQVDRFVGLISYKRIEALILKHESLLPAPSKSKHAVMPAGEGSIDPVTKRYLPPGISRK